MSYRNTTTTITACIPGAPPGIYRVGHDVGVDPVEAIKAAAREYVRTENGQEYLEFNVGGDCFNWGDAVKAIPLGTLMRHGIRALVVIDTLGAIVVDHDECIA